MSRNIFLLGRHPGPEDQLTEMLVWLISAVPEVGRVLVRLAFGDIDLDLGELEVTTQHRIAGGRLDALVKSESLVLVVESKLGSVYGAGQLRAYVNWLATRRKDVAHKALMTLTASEAPWTAQDLAHAAQLHVVASPRRWHELYTELLSLTKTLDELPARLAQEFRGMLREEGLIPPPREPVSDEQSWFAVLETRGGDETRAARDLYNWTCARCWRHAFRASPGGGGTWRPHFLVDGREYSPIEFSTSGRIAVHFRVGGQPPFDGDHARFELLKLVNRIPGVRYDPAAVTKQSIGFELRVLARNHAALEQLEQILEWVEAKAGKPA